MAPPKWRGRLNTLVQCGTITGIVIGSGINIGANVRRPAVCTAAAPLRLALARRLKALWTLGVKCHRLVAPACSAAASAQR